MRLLHDLLDYAIQEKLFTPFWAVSVNAKLIIGANGYVGIEPFDKGVRRISVPIVKRTGLVVRPYALYDNEEYSLGVVLDEDRSKQRFDAYWEQTEEHVRKAGDRKALAAVRATMANWRWLKGARATVEKIQSAMKGESRHVMLALALEDGELLVERPAIRKYFETTLEDSMSDEDGPDTCLTTGRKCTAVLTHDAIQGVPGAGGNFPLVSFNQATSRQGNLQQGRMFPMSTFAMKGYTAGLNALVANNRFNISPSACGLVWGTKAAPHIARVISLAKQEDLQPAWAALEAFRTSDETLRVLFLKGSQARQAVLSYRTVPTKTAVETLLRFREHFRTDYAEPSVLSRLRAVSPSTGKDNESRQLIDGMSKVRAIEAMLNGGTGSGEKPMLIPADVISRIVHALSPAHLVDDRDSAKAAQYAARCQLAWFEFVLFEKPNLPGRRSHMENEEPRIDAYVHQKGDRLDAYNIGRAIALEEAIRGQAHQRDYGASSMPMASINPAVWCQDHARRIRTYVEKLGRRGRKGTHFTRLLDEVMIGIDVTTISRTTPFSAVEQAQLCLGYSQQQGYIKAYRRWQRWQREHNTNDKAAE
jgi:hypothetical protein